MQFWLCNHFNGELLLLMNKVVFFVRHLLVIVFNDISCFVLAYNVPINTPILVLKHGAETDLTTKNTFSRCNYLMCMTNKNILRLHR